MHLQASSQLAYEKALATVNQNEITAYTGNDYLFKDGKEFIDHRHNYSFDLDIFGPKSIYHKINRSHTYIGGKYLAEYLSEKKSNQDIVLNQKAILELSEKLDWRQTLQATAALTNDSKTVFTSIEEWANSANDQLSNSIKLLAFILPTILIISFAVYMLTGSELARILSTFIFILNIGMLGLCYKSIAKEMRGESNMHASIKNYSQLLQLIEQQDFKSDKLKSIQSSLVSKNGTSASNEISTLSTLFQNMDTIFNPIGAILFNGTILFHIHMLSKLKNWKARHAKDIGLWVNAIGDIEALISLATFKYNNPSYVFPSINKEEIIKFKGVGHPLLDAETRVVNDITFEDQNFIILTGSNMSGKSTFLRCLGINMALAGCGSVVCASQADIHPLDIYVSMRLTDSLSDNESYFFAEVRRLKEIMDATKDKLSFILLDEILRGTNSDDKRIGTVEVIKKLISQKVIGAIATHDLKVCDTTSDYPDQLINKNFEVEIREGELVFDYKLRDGVCKNKSATYIMKKMQVI